MIVYHQDSCTFHLTTRTTSYLFTIGTAGHLRHLYYGPRLAHQPPFAHLQPVDPLVTGSQTLYSADHPGYVQQRSQLEYSTPGKGDYRDPSAMLTASDGDSTFDFRYHDHRLSLEKPSLPGLPSALAKNPTENIHLEIELLDAQRSMALILGYSVLEDCDVLCRWARFENRSDQPVFVEKAMSLCLDLENDDWELLSLDGAWIRERHLHRRPLGPGKTVLSSRRGVSSSDHAAFAALLRRGTGQHSGAAVGVGLLYSGNHVEAAEVDPHGGLRMQCGINDEGFRWFLPPGETFQSPEAVLSFSPVGLNGLSHSFHRLVENHIIPEAWKGKERPILVNNWEATYFDFNEKKLLDLAKDAGSLGIELFVLDDGWFGERNDDLRSLGDWTVNRKKLPSGLGGLADKIRKKGLDFGLWVEPEMVSEDSDLHRAHPDWMMRSPVRPPSPARTQFVLDLANTAVVDHLFTVLSDAFREARVSYVKWDMNRNFSDVFAPSLPAERQGETAHRYVLGLYDLLGRLKEAFPQVLFESCASGGNRFDLGMLAFMPQVWTSDNTDAVERLDIQEGTSLFSPPSTMGAHVSAVPNHQTLRTTPIESRFNTAAFGLLGYELDLNRLTPFEHKVVKKQIAFYKEHRQTLQFGRFYRLEHPDAPNGKAWMSVAADADKAILGVFQKVVRPNALPKRIPLVGLNPGRRYRVEGRIQYLDLASLGDLATEALPGKMDTQGAAFRALAARYLLPMEAWEFEAQGDQLIYGGFRPPQPFHGGGYDETIALMTDYSSRLYVITALD